MPRTQLSDHVHVRAMRLLVFVMIAAIGLVAPFAGSAAPSTRSVVTRDSFSRARDGAWGTADNGGRYRTTGHSSSFAVTGGKGRIVLRRAHADANVNVVRASVRDAVVRFRFGVSRLANGGGLAVSAVFRGHGLANQYRVPGSASRAIGPSGWPCSGSVAVSSGPSAMRSA